MIDIRLCNIDEIDKLQLFIDTSWKKDHILAKDKGLLLWQHSGTYNNKINFVIAIETTTNEILGILGFIPLYHFDKELTCKNDFWLAVWKIKENYKGIGIQLLNYININFKPSSIGSIGINNVVKKLYKALNFKTGKLSQYYILNPYTEVFKIAQVQNNTLNLKIIDSKYSIRELSDISAFTSLKHQYSPDKSINFLTNRYIKHPTYKYKFYGTFFEGNLKCIFITRKINVCNSSCIRIVDIYGSINNIGSIKSELVKLLINENSEYIDCLNYGISQNEFFNLGFSLRENDIIPNYFEPFEKTNIDIELAFSCNYENYVIFKGDSDQDRPNIISNS